MRQMTDLAPRMEKPAPNHAEKQRKGYRERQKSIGPAVARREVLEGESVGEKIRV